MNVGALAATLVFFALLSIVYIALFVSARRSVVRGEMKPGGPRLLGWAFVGSSILFVLLALTAFLV